MSVIVNDIHSELNLSEVNEVVAVDSLEMLCVQIRLIGELGYTASIAGGRYAMGGQQFCTGEVMLDMRNLNRVLEFDDRQGLIKVEAGIQWPELVDYLDAHQTDSPTHWTIAQKQTGADRLTIGGAVSANVHGRGLNMQPFISDIESFDLVNADGKVLECSRNCNSELFRLVAGGYGLFGCIYAVTLRLRPRQVLERIVELGEIDNLIPRFNERIRDGFVYGDFQFMTDDKAEGFLRTGVFSCYRPVEWDQPLPTNQRDLSLDDWMHLITLAHTDKQQAFVLYSQHYLATSGQLYYSDRHQLTHYLDGYHAKLDSSVDAEHRSTEIITELYVPRDRLTDFMVAVSEDFRTHNVDLIYGTIRLIERDDESFLAWASEAWACIIFNLHTTHTPEGIQHSKEAFQRLIDLAIERNGKFYLTYQKWATREQIEKCYPQMGQFLRLKQQFDPEERFQSDWYRHYRDLFRNGKTSGSD